LDASEVLVRTNQPTNPDLAMGIKVEGYEGSGA